MPADWEVALLRDGKRHHDRLSKRRPVEGAMKPMRSSFKFYHGSVGWPSGLRIILPSCVEKNSVNGPMSKSEVMTQKTWVTYCFLANPLSSVAFLVSIRQQSPEQKSGPI